MHNNQSSGHAARLGRGQPATLTRAQIARPNAQIRNDGPAHNQFAENLISQAEVDYISAIRIIKYTNRRCDALIKTSL